MNGRRERWRARRRLALIALLLTAYLPLHGIWRMVRLQSPWPRRFLRDAARAAGVDVHVVGEPARHNVLFIANHLSWLDILILAGATGARFVAKDDVAHWPLLGFLSKLNRTIYVERSQRTKAQAQSDKLRSALGEGQPVALFPEGGTGDGTALRPFRASLFSALFPPIEGIVVQPVAIDYGADTLAMVWGDTDVGVETMRVLSLPGRRRAALRFIDSIAPAEYSGRKTLAKHVEVSIAMELDLRVNLPRERLL